MSVAGKARRELTAALLAELALRPAVPVARQLAVSAALAAALAALAHTLAAKNFPVKLTDLFNRFFHTCFEDIGLQEECWLPGKLPRWLHSVAARFQARKLCLEAR